MTKNVMCKMHSKLPMEKSLGELNFQNSKSQVMICGPLKDKWWHVEPNGLSKTTNIPSESTVLQINASVEHRSSWEANNHSSRHEIPWAYGTKRFTTM